MPFQRGQNIWAGRRHSLESRKKMSLARIGNKIWLGKHHSEDSKKKMSEAAKNRIHSTGWKHSLETRQRLSELRKGKRLSEETKKKISLNHSRHTLGKHLSEETKLKISQANKGRIPSLEVRQKLREAGLKKEGTAANGYRSFSVSKGKRIGEHRLIIQKTIGRPLQRKEYVHHWNENRLDNRIENLALFRSNAAHTRLHFFAKRHGLKTEALKFDQPWLIPQT